MACGPWPVARLPESPSPPAPSPPTWTWLCIPAGQSSPYRPELPLQAEAPPTARKCLLTRQLRHAIQGIPSAQMHTRTSPWLQGDRGHGLDALNSS